MKFLFKPQATFLFLSTVSPLAFGQFTITPTTYGDLASFPGASEALDTIYDTLETQINSSLPQFDFSTLFKGVADGTATAGSGTDADYASGVDFGIIGVNVGAAAKFKDNFGLSDISSSGISAIQGGGVQAGLMLGATGKVLPQFKIGPFDSHRAKGYMSFFFFGRSFNDLDFGGTTADLDVSVKHFAVAGQYKIVEERKLGAGVLKWGGVDLTGGLRYNSFKGTVTANIPTVALAQQTVASVLTVTPSFTNGEANLIANSSTFSIPMEASTWARVLYFLTLYTGFGLDINLGSTSGTGSATGDIQTNFTNTISNQPLTNQPSATAAYNLGNNGSPYPVGLRNFTGIQIDMGVLAVYAQLNKAVVGGPLGATFGAKAFW